MPEEIKGLLRVLVDEYAEIQKLLKGLERDVETLASSYRRSRWERIAIVVVLVASITLGVLYVVDGVERRAEFRGQLRDLACLAVRRTAPGVSGTVDDLRQRYDCPPYAALGRPGGPSATTGRPTPVRPAPSPTPSAAALPAPTPTPPAAMRSPVAVTRTVSRPGPTRTVVARPTPSTTTSPTPTPTPPGLLPVLLCRDLGLPLCTKESL